jgi:2-keto-4-pentenoate hydratase/2-oxohepta-3-ene-1,7-dioic acid hydratase in catechol pathway
MTAFLTAGEPAMASARKAVEAFKRGEGRDAAVPLQDADLQAPVPRPGKILMGGRNYLRHLDELRKEGAGRGEKIVPPRRCRTSLRSITIPSPGRASP